MQVNPSHMSTQQSALTPIERSLVLHQNADSSFKKLINAVKNLFLKCFCCRNKPSTSTNHSPLQRRHIEQQASTPRQQEPASINHPQQEPTREQDFEEELRANEQEHQAALQAIEIERQERLHRAMQQHRDNLQRIQEPPQRQQQTAQPEVQETQRRNAQETQQRRNGYLSFLRGYQTENPRAYAIAFPQFEQHMSAISPLLPYYERGEIEFGQEEQQSFLSFYTPAVALVARREANQTYLREIQRQFPEAYEQMRTAASPCDSSLLTTYTLRPLFTAVLTEFYNGADVPGRRELIQEELTAYRVPREQRAQRNQQFLQELGRATPGEERSSASLNNELNYITHIPSLLANYGEFESNFQNGTIALSPRLERELRALFQNT